ncbi:hypothetical protein RhiirC2_797068 [Rhizophagus irregularis]|uniref:Uncharacterized protein n=1 Tax=Rhizophagus irregularis TaxID=588596 RepID=A0A2N1M8N6_9GLOM|nr:hypothetical protein RhiirC2_797068 [Rhizophagus irregularis]
MAKIWSYYMHNIQKELSYMNQDLTESVLRESTNITSVNSIISIEENDDTVNFDEDNNLNQISLSENFQILNWTLVILLICQLLMIVMILIMERCMGSDITSIQEQPLKNPEIYIQRYHHHSGIRRSHGVKL